MNSDLRMIFLLYSYIKFDFYPWTELDWTHGQSRMDRTSQERYWNQDFSLVEHTYAGCYAWISTNQLGFNLNSRFNRSIFLALLRTCHWFFHPYKILEPWMTCKIGIGMCEKRRNYALNALLKWHRVNLCSWTTWGGRQVWRFETNINSLILPLPTLIQFYIELDFVQGNHDYTDKGRTPNCDTWITHKIVIPE